MKKFLLPLSLMLSLMIGAKAQTIDNKFFDHVSYIGAFGSSDWTKDWTEWDPVNAVYPEATTTKGNAQFSRSTGLHITADETWSGVIKLDGWVYVDAGATLTVKAGTIVRGTEKSGIFVERGGKINAVGTANSPIVFTPNQGAGLRGQSDWAGIVLCGKAPNNLAGGEVLPKVVSILLTAVPMPATTRALCSMFASNSQVTKWPQVKKSTA